MLKSSGNIKNSIWNLANILLYPIAFLGLTPFFINNLGENSFGIWMLVNSYVYIAVNIISFGLGNSITAHIAEALGKLAGNKLHGYVNAATKIVIWISTGTALVALLWFVGNFFGYSFFEDNLDEILIIATLLISVKFWELLYQNIQKGFERYDIASFLNISSKLIVLSAQVVIVLSGYSLWEIFLSNLVLNIVLVLIQAVVTYRLIPGYKFKVSTLKEDRQDIFHFGFWTWLQTIVSVAAYQVDRWVVAIFLGPATAGYYILASTIINHLHMAFGAVVSWLFPKIARKKETESNILIYFYSLRGFSIGSSLLAILILFLLYEPVFTLWLGAEKFVKMGEYFRMFLIFESFLIMTIVPLFFLNGMKMLKFITSLEFMYKLGIIAGLIVGFTIKPTAESLIIGQSVALAVLIPLEYFLINKKLIHDNWFSETIITMLPSFLISLVIIYDNMIVTIVLSILAAILFSAYYLRKKRFNVKLLLE